VYYKYVFEERLETGVERINLSSFCGRFHARGGNRKRPLAEFQQSVVTITRPEIATATRNL